MLSPTKEVGSENFYMSVNSGFIVRLVNWLKPDNAPDSMQMGLRPSGMSFKSNPILFGKPLELNPVMWFSALT